MFCCAPNNNSLDEPSKIRTEAVASSDAEARTVGRDAGTPRRGDIVLQMPDATARGADTNADKELIAMMYLRRDF
jgi:hypothetical protein|tara:strand:+ start:1393 stop:1617 length:225 start_codon:yes stop_codon:yes gene_type:complete